MPSRKKAKGKARKAAKEAAKEEKNHAVAVAAIDRLEESLAEMLVLQISQFYGSTMKCRHGFDDISPICNEFVVTIIPVFLSYSKGNMIDAFNAVHEATAGAKFTEVYSSKLESIVSMLVAVGTNSFLLGGVIAAAQLSAVLACYFEEWVAVKVRKTKAFINWFKVIELYDADEHTLVKFFRKRITCSCLDEKYKAVKSVKKMGWCCNPSCSQPGSKVERSKMFCCTRCGEVNYCSIECQKEDWKEHRNFCNEIAEVKAAFKKQS